MNLQPMRPSRRRPNPGDVFAMHLPDLQYMFGRVISNEAMAGWSLPGSILIYVYRFKSPNATMPEPSELALDKLLISPVMTNALPWSKGYFETVGNRPLQPDDAFKVHCFRSSTGKYYDEKCVELPSPKEPCGDWGLHSFRTVDDEVSDALGIPLSRS